MSCELVLEIPDGDLFDNDKLEFIPVKGCSLRLKHSLYAISEWESKWKVPFLEEKPPKTPEQMLDYVKMMTLNKNVDPNVYLLLTTEDWEKIRAYIEDPMTATWFNDKDKSRAKKKVVTSELIYYWMVAQNIPIDICEKWHLNRLLTLIRVCSIESQPPKKMGKSSIMNQNRMLNEARKAKYHTRG